MSKKPDPELLGGFVEEARLYLSLIPRYIDEFLADREQFDKIEAVFRHAHSIKGASSMMGLTALSQLGRKLEWAAEEIGTEPEKAVPAKVALVRETANVIGKYLDRCLAGDHDDISVLSAVSVQWEQFSDECDAVAVARLFLPVDDTHSPKRSSEASIKVSSTPDIELIPESDSDDPLEDDLEAEPTAIEEPFPMEFAFDSLHSSEAGFGPDGMAEDEGTLPEPARAADEEAIPPELLEIFALEAEDHLRKITTHLPALQNAPNSADLILEIRRSAHTLKGSAAMVGFDRITRLTHRMEDLLDQVHEQGRPVTPDVLQILFQSTDLLEDLTSGKKCEAELRELEGRYTLLLAWSDEAVPEQEEAPALAAQLEGEVAAAPAELEAEPEEAAERSKQGQFLRVPIEKMDALIRLVGELVISRSEFEQRLGNHLRLIEELTLSSSRLRRASVKLETEYEARTLASGRALNSSGWQDPKLPLALTGHRSYGFDDLEFDRYTDFHLLSRELSETTTDIQTLANELRVLDGEFEGHLVRQTRLEADLQDKLTRVRMVPLSTLASRLERTVRNAADICAKTVELKLEGESTELDKTMLETMSEPLLHLLRNGVDHGIESAEVRRQLGKPETGTIRVRAFPSGSQIVLEISDDGGGIDPKKLCETIVARGLSKREELEGLPDDRIFEYMFRPGFSTAKEVSEISGRGVGLDIVRSQVQRLKGTLSVASKLGEGTSFTIRLPLTLAVMKALMVKSCGETFAIPLTATSQVLRLEAEMLDTSGPSPALRLGEKAYPLIDLGAALGLRPAGEETTIRKAIAIVRAGEKEIAVSVDQLLGGREIVVKNLGNHVKRARGIAGATIMGDGSVVLIVNPADLDRQQSPSSLLASHAREEAGRVTRAEELDRMNVLIVDDSPSVRRVVAGIFQRAGWESASAKDGMEALEYLHLTARRPDAIVLDIEMPRMDGYEFLSTLRAVDTFGAIPVVMVTSRAGQKHRRKAMDLGANAYLVKPYQDDELIETIREMVAESAGVPA